MEKVIAVIPVGGFHSNPIDLDPEYVGSGTIDTGSSSGSSGGGQGGSSSSTTTGPGETSTSTSLTPLEPYEEKVEVTLIPFERAPEVLAVNSDFDEGRIDPVTGYPIPDCDDIRIVGGSETTGSLVGGAGNSELSLSATKDHLDGLFSSGDTVTDDLHSGWFGISPSEVDDDFWDGAVVTISKLNPTVGEGERPETGEVRFYAVDANGQSHWGIEPYLLGSETGTTSINLVTDGVHNTTGGSL